MVIREEGGRGISTRPNQALQILEIPYRTEGKRGYLVINSDLIHTLDTKQYAEKERETESEFERSVVWREGESLEFRKWE